MQHITQGIFYEDTYIGVTVGALIFPFGSIAIDAPLRSEDTRAWRAAINNFRGGSNRMLINLDAHPDRTLGTRALECTIVAHQKAAQVFRNRPTIFKGLNIETGAIWETYNDAIGLRWASPDITFTDKMFLHWGGPEVILEQQPGPTPGSIWVHIPDEKTVFVGDTLVLNQPPFLAQADLTVWIGSLNALLETHSGYSIVSGRGGLAKPDDIHFLLKFLQDVSDSIENLGLKNAQPEATHEMATRLVSRFNVTGKQREFFLTRLRFGLQQYYARRFHPATVIGQPEIREDDQ